VTTNNIEDLKSYLAVKKLQDSSRSFNKKVLLSLAALVVVAAIAMIYTSSGSEVPEANYFDIGNNNPNQVIEHIT